MACKMKCSEPCNISPCNRPCSKILECGHSCIGFCGDECPPKCLECDPSIAECFFGTEDVYSKYVYLPDCKHVLESTAMDTWMKPSDSGEDENIGLKSCPKCKTVIRNCTRYKRLINQQLELVDFAKKKILKNIVNEEVIKDEIFQNFSYDSSSFSNVENVIKLGSYLKENIKCMQIQGSSERNVARIKTLISIFKTFEKFLYSREITNDTKNEIDDVAGWLYHIPHTFSEQQESDLELMIKRIKFLMKRDYYQSELAKRYKSLQQTLLRYLDFDQCTIYKKIEKGACVEGKDLNIIIECFEKAAKYDNIDLNAQDSLTLEQKIVLVKALNIPNGHWFKCKNGHIYAIGDCGGAVEKSVCPDCKSVIGGESYRLAEGNQHTGELDGTQISSYDTAYQSKK